MKPRRFAIIFGLLATASWYTLFADTGPTVRSGRFCAYALNASSLSSEDCLDIEGETIGVVSSPEAQKWVWIEDGGPAIAVGLLPADAESLTLPGRSAPYIDVQISGDRDRGWPVAIDLRILPEQKRARPSDGDGWAFTITRERARIPIHLHLPPGNWQLTADAPGHLSATRERLELERDVIDLGTLELEPAPRVGIRVTDSSGAPIAGAMMLDPHEPGTLAVSDPTGRIDWSPERGELPAELKIEATGFAPKSIDIRERRSDLVLDPLVLGRGGILRLVVDRPPSDDTVDVELIRNQRRRNRDGSEGQVVASGTVGPEEREIELELVEAGRYSLHLNGRKALEHWAEHVEITEGETKLVEITLEPFELEVAVTLDGQPLPRATLEIGTPTAPGPKWSGTLHTNDEGIATGIAWQRSINLAVVHSEEPQIHSLEWFKLEGRANESIEIAIRNMKISGTVVDGETGTPMPDIAVEVRWKGAGGAGMFSMTTDESGTFERGGLKPGAYILSISRPDYMPIEESVEISEEVPEGRAEIVLERGELLQVRVVDETGAPMANATIMEMASRQGDAPHSWFADVQGRAAIPMGADTRREVWFAAPGGTFGHAVLDRSVRGSEESPVPLVMPQPAGAITIAALDEDGNPVSSVWLAIQHDKTPLPERLVDLLARLRGIVFRTGLDGTVTIPNMPKGLYEWWTWKIDSDHVSFGVPIHQPRPPAKSHFFSGGHERVVIVVPQKKE